MTSNGFDERWVHAINDALADRETDARVDDLTHSLWDRYIGPMLDAIEQHYDALRINEETWAILHEHYGHQLPPRASFDPHGENHLKRVVAFTCDDAGDYHFARAFFNVDQMLVDWADAGDIIHRAVDLTAAPDHAFVSIAAELSRCDDNTDLSNWLQS